MRDQTEPAIPLAGFRIIADGLDHPECVATGPDGQLYAGGEAGQIYRIDPDGAHEIANTGGFVLGICLDADGNIYAGDLKRHEVVRITPEGTIARHGGPIGVPNYPVFTADGHLLVSDSGAWDADGGRLVRIAPDGSMETVDVEARAFPNGLAISPDGEWLYLVLSTVPGVARVRLDGSQPRGAVEVVVELPLQVPDGLAFCADGSLLIACYTPDVIYRWDGHELTVLAFDHFRTTIAAPTNVAFHGPGLSRLAVASLGRWHLLETHLAGTGAPLNYPKLSR